MICSSGAGGCGYEPKTGGKRVDGVLLLAVLAKVLSVVTFVWSARRVNRLRDEVDRLTVKVDGQTAGVTFRRSVASGYPPGDG